MVQMRKVILADSLGETSVSVENVSYVICSGKREVYRFDPVKKVMLYGTCILVVCPMKCFGYYKEQSKEKQYFKLYIYNLNHFLSKFFATSGSMCCIGW